ncbi:hypothetical protein HUN33_10635 [Acinetobacter bereziniae]|uniref:hypothetical protein n=1 Tax=Acinetobacter bereziniae TaxID=106648 RepID=UPI001580E9E0|nr:hypothetical protein [Acinetobacter bereziniae]NUF63034.1 hypothetical protein [Acinetobacter bereziniae]NUG07942.1 hypothetical protein [Acinetobacter bereziniae]NUG64712.1 hypothetical protein [Acinetobacter bereziniae]NUG69439.1 hypothetical protein [Acinetobacter bereziniae]NUG80506.1 hypothetical protein [Acinetobacter bereziniae]
MKKIMMLVTIAMFTVGCDKQPETAQAQNTAVKTEAVKAKAQTNKLTEKELQDLESLEKSPSVETAATAGYYLSNLEVTPVTEIREFIAKGWDEWETLNRQEAEKETQQVRSDQGDASMQYRIEIKNQVFGGKHEVETAYLHLISLSDSITLDRVVVNRGNCKADYRDGANPILYGKTMRFFLNCDPRNVREVVAVLKDGREIVMSPQ